MAILSFSRRFDPMNALVRLQEEFVRDPGTSGWRAFPAVNVLDDEDDLVVQLEVPGIAPENLSIEASGRTLTVSGKREPAVPAQAGFRRQEGWSGEFSRSLQLPADVDPARAEATHKHGVLSIRIPKREEARPRQIEVKVEDAA